MHSERAMHTKSNINIINEHTHTQARGDRAKLTIGSRKQTQGTQYSHHAHTHTDSDTATRKMEELRKNECKNKKKNNNERKK